jgi:hypothetical protein
MSSGGATSTGGAPTGGASPTGGSSQTGGDVGQSSGSRLKAKHYVGADGSKQFAGWYDSQLKADCWFQQVNGKTVCTPTLWSSSYYADAACTVPLFYTTAIGCGGIAYEYGASNYDCNARRIYRLQAMSAPASMYSKGTACTAMSPPASGAGITYSYFSAQEVPLTTFVEASVQTDP